MQRWIVLGLVAVALIVGGGGFAAWQYRQNRPAPMWVQLPLNPELDKEKRDDVVAKIKGHLLEPEVLQRVSSEMRLAEKWGSPSEAAAADELGRRIFVEIGEMRTDMGNRNPSLNVGIRGPRKEKELSGRISMRLMQEVWDFLGIKPRER